MAGRWTLTKAYEYFGAKPVNPRWSWSAKSDDGRVIVLTIWEDEIKNLNGTMVLDVYGNPRLADWTNRFGNRERIRNLIWARDQCGGLFRVVMNRAKDINASPRSILATFPHETLVMRLTDLNEITGEFRAESVYF